MEKDIEEVCKKLGLDLDIILEYPDNEKEGIINLYELLLELFRTQKTIDIVMQRINDDFHSQSFRSLIETNPCNTAIIFNSIWRRFSK